MMEAQAFQLDTTDTGMIDGSRVPIVDVDESETLPPGLYRIARLEFPAKIYDGYHDEFREATGGELLLRIDHGTDLPPGVQMARFRADGCRVVKMWVFNNW